jgi:hypothetical protein
MSVYPCAQLNGQSPKSNYDFFAPTTTNTIPPASANPPMRGETGMVFWVSAVATRRGRRGDWLRVAIRAYTANME